MFVLPLVRLMEDAEGLYFIRMLNICYLTATIV